MALFLMWEVRAGPETLTAGRFLEPLHQAGIGSPTANAGTLKDKGADEMGSPS
jgi:hypothetical protein